MMRDSNLNWFIMLSIIQSKRENGTDDVIETVLDFMSRRDWKKTEWRCDDSELDPSDHWSFGQIRPINGHQRTGSTIVAVLLKPDKPSAN